MEDLGFSLNLASPSLSSPIVLSPAGGWGNIIGGDSTSTTYYASPSISNPPPTVAANGQLVTFFSVPSGSSPISFTKVITTGGGAVSSLRYIINGGSLLAYATPFPVVAGDNLRIGLTTSAVAPASETGTILVRDALNRVIVAISYSIDLAI